MYSLIYSSGVLCYTQECFTDTLAASIMVGTIQAITFGKPITIHWLVQDLPLMAGEEASIELTATALVSHSCIIGLLDLSQAGLSCKCETAEHTV